MSAKSFAVRPAEVLGAALVLLGCACTGVTESKPGVDSGSDPGADSGSDPGADIRFLHLSPDAPAIDVVGGGQELGAGLEFTEASAPVAVPRASADIDVLASGSDESVASLQDVGLEPNRRYTGFAFGELASIQANVLEDGTEGLSTGNVRLRLVHAAQGVGVVDIVELREGSAAPLPLAEDLRFGTVAPAVDRSPEPFDVGVDVDGDDQTDLIFSIPELDPGTVVNAFVTLDGDGEPFLLALLPDSTTVRIDPVAPESRLRLVHLSRDAPNVDVYADGELIGSDLAYADATDELVVPSGTYDVAVAAAGSDIEDAVLEVDGLTFEPGLAYSAIAYGDLTPPAEEPASERPLQLLVLEDDASGLDTSSDVRLTVAHAATTVIRGDVYSVTGSGNVPLAGDLGFGEAATLDDLPSSSYTVGFDAGANGIIDVDFDLPEFAPGSYVNLYVATDANDDVFLLAQTEGAGAIEIPAN